MAEPTVKHFIVTRFFPKQDVNYLYNILHRGFLEKQATLAANNELKTLANQTNQNFEIVFFVNGKLIVDENYESILKILREASPVPIHFFNWGEYAALIQDAYANYDFVIASRLDFDDFLHKDAVADVQSKINECGNVLLYGYCKGYLYADKGLRHILYPAKKRGHLGILQSWIWRSSFAKNLPVYGPYGPHARVKIKLKEFLEKNDIEFSENMFQQNITTNAFIYFRHEFSHFIVIHDGNANDPWIVDEGGVTADEITRKQLEEDYGFTYELKSIE